ncbi:unnamed protein product [Lymnaea stagnalis]|uniref:U3 small nucleolar RNA-associated protein 14 homolog A n=1 Tax=Lymnaea stagnalis TaxID=6523 RepID=A0AAV2I7F5_LYMST
MELENIVEEAVDERAHERLLDSLFALDGKKRHNVALRRSTNFSSNLDLVVHASQDTAKIQPGDLKLKRKNASFHLKKPLGTLELEKTKRKLTREALVTEMTKWDPVVKEMRSADQIAYSKRQHGIQMFQAVQPQAFVPRTPLEQEIYAALGKSQDTLKPHQEFTEAEARALKAMSIKEARARRSELMKHHELLSRIEQKAKRQKKIKSKRYRKLLKADRLTAEKRQMEYLQKNDPDALHEKLKKIHEDRMEERLTLKHRGGGKFSRLHKAYSKYDDKTREAVQEMFKKSRELTKKDENISDDDDDDDNNINTKFDKLISNVTGETSQEIINHNVKYPKIISDKANAWLEGSKAGNKMPPTQILNPISTSTEAVIPTPLAEEASRLPDSLKKVNSVNKSEQEITEIKKQRKSTISEPVSKRKLEDKNKESNADDPSVIDEVRSPISMDKSKLKREKQRKPTNTDGKTPQSSGPEKPVPESVLYSHDSKTDDSKKTLTMEELFQDEDVIEEFTKEKAEIEGRKKLEVDLKLPGWGTWAGPDYKKAATNRQKRFSKSKRTPHQRKPSQTAKAPFVWINPNRDEAMKKLLPKAVPFPFTSVQQYESSLRQPVSRGLVPESATKLLTKPEVVTKLGHIIKPILKEDYFSKSKSSEMDLK